MQMLTSLVNQSVAVVRLGLFSRKLFEKSVDASPFVSIRLKSNKSAAKKIQSLLWTMPKEEKHLKSLQLQRQEKKKKRFLDQPYRIFWQVMGNGGPGAPTSLFLSTDLQGYFFNCGEGTQRMSAFMNVGKTLGQTDNVFITSKSWKNLGGLPGLCLTVRSHGASEITIHGPPGCMDIYDATKGFLVLSEFNVHNYKERLYTDNAVNIEEIQLHRSTSLRPPDVDSTWENGEEELVPYVDCVQAYVCNFIPRKGKLDVEKCVDAGVPPGPLFGQLKAGKDITLPDGRVIRSSDVVGHNSPATSTLVLEIPDVEYIDALEASVKLRDIANLENVFHFTPPDVARNERYLAWMHMLPSSVQHVFINENSTGMGLVGVTAHQAKLRLMNKTLFPRLEGTQDDPTPGFQLHQQLCSNIGDLNVVQAKTGLKVNVRPPEEPRLELDELVYYDEEAVIKTVLEGTEIPFDCDREEYVAGLQEDLRIAHAEDAPGEQENFGDVNDNKIYPEITFLGTGSAIPSKYRNVSSILVEVKPDYFILLDCGEGSLSQLYRLYGKDRARSILKNLKAIYLSHQHADHHLGTINMLLERTSVFSRLDEPVPCLYIVTTAQYRHFLNAYHHKIQSILSNTKLVKCEELIFYAQRDEYQQVIPGDKIQLIAKDLLQEFLQHSGLSEIEACKAVHCPHAFCIAFRTEGGYKMTYSGDTRPCDYLVNIGRDSDLLIHEASMEQLLIQDAILKKHSTFTEAIKEGRDMGAKFTLLTHFSQRYAKAPLLEEIEGQPNVGIAFDNLVVNPKTMRTIPSIYPALKRIFHTEFAEMKEKSQQASFALDDSVPIVDESVQRLMNEKAEKIKRIEQKEAEKQKKYEYLQKKQLKKKERDERRREAENCRSTEAENRQLDNKAEKRLIDKLQGVSKKVKIDH